MSSYLCPMNSRLLSIALLLLGSAICPFQVGAQSHPLQPLTAVLDFGDVFTDEPQTLILSLQNSGETELTIPAALSFNEAFSVSGSDWVLSAGATLDIAVEFSPRHNIVHDTELLILCDGPYGQVAVDLRGRGVYADAYYNPTQDLSQEALKNALSSLISGHASLGYTPARDQMYMVIDNQRVNGMGAAVNTLETCYIGRIASGWTDRTDAQNSYNVNTEHTWPQSAFGSSEPMQSDLFHLFIADAVVNSTRGNLPFGNVITPDWTNGGAKRGGGLFEPRDGHKGRTSRAVLYFFLRYGNFGSYMNSSQENALRGWHRDFVPDSIELRRNDAIYALQNNRNPLIDHPEFEERISHFLSTATEPERNTLELIEEEIRFGSIAVGASISYDLVLVADGNRDISITPEAMSHPDLSVEWPLGPVAAGQSELVRITYAPTSLLLLLDTLRFSSSSENRTETAIAVSGSAIPTGLITNHTAGPGWNCQLDANGVLSANWTQPVSGVLRVYSLSGQLIFSQNVEAQQELRLAVPTSSQGWYVAEWQSETGNAKQMLYRP